MHTYFEQLSSLTNISTNILLLCNTAGEISYCNQHGITFFFGSNSKQPLPQYFAAPYEAIIRQQLQEVSQHQRPTALHIFHKERYYNFFIYPFEKEIGVCIEDITERRQLSQLLENTYRRLNFAEKIAKLGYWEVDLNAKKIFWSAEMFNLFGVDAKTISMKRNIIKEQMFKEDLPLYRQKLRELIKLGRPIEGMVRIQKPNGQIAHCFFKASLVVYEHKKQIAGTFQDLTNLIEIQHALEKARQTAEGLSKAKSHFLAQASHDLRQPMQALNIFITTLAEENLSLRQQSLVSKIGASAENLRLLLDNLLDISKLEAGGVVAHNYEFDIGDLLEKLLKEYQELAKSQNINLKSVNCSYHLYSDPILIERILRNFLSNAFKYTKNKILVGCRLYKKHLRIEVVDNGYGIGDEEQEQIFEEFFQSRNVPHNLQQGSGLGLTIVKKIADILGCNVGVNSKVNQGSCFYLEIPYK